MVNLKQFLKTTIKIASLTVLFIVANLQARAALAATQTNRSTNAASGFSTAESYTSQRGKSSQENKRSGRKDVFTVDKTAKYEVRLKSGDREKNNQANAAAGAASSFVDDNQANVGTASNSSSASGSFTGNNQAGPSNFYEGIKTKKQKIPYNTLEKALKDLKIANQTIGQAISATLQRTISIMSPQELKAPGSEKAHILVSMPKSPRGTDESVASSTKSEKVQNKLVTLYWRFGTFVKWNRKTKKIVIEPIQCFKDNLLIKWDTNGPLLHLKYGKNSSIQSFPNHLFQLMMNRSEKQLKSENIVQNTIYMPAVKLRQPYK